MDAAGCGEFFEGDGLSWVEAVRGDPILDFVQVYGREVCGEPKGALQLVVLRAIPRYEVYALRLRLSSDAVHDPVWRLATIEACRYFAMLLLTLVSSPGRFTVAARGPSSDANALVVCALVVRELREDGCGAGLLEHGVEEGRERLIWSVRHC